MCFVGKYAVALRLSKTRGTKPSLPNVTGTPTFGGGGGWQPRLLHPPTHPPTHIRKFFLGKTMKFIKGA